MNFKTNLFEDYIKFTDLKKKQSTYFKMIIPLFVNIVCLFFIFVFIKYNPKKFLYNNNNYYTILINYKINHE